MFFKKKKKEKVKEIEQIPDVGTIQITKVECSSKKVVELSDGTKPAIYTNNDGEQCVIIDQN